MPLRGKKADALFDFSKLSAETRIDILFDSTPLTSSQKAALSRTKHKPVRRKGTRRVRRGVGEVADRHGVHQRVVGFPVVGRPALEDVEPGLHGPRRIRLEALPVSRLEADLASAELVRLDSADWTRATSAPISSSAWFSLPGWVPAMSRIRRRCGWRSAPNGQIGQALLVAHALEEADPCTKELVDHLARVVVGASSTAP